MFPRLRHRTIRRRYHQNRAIHLRRSGDHVLDVVCMSRAIHVRVVPVRRFIFHVRNGNRDAALALFRRIVDRIERAKLYLRVVLRQNFGDRRRQRCLAVINVTDGPNVHVRLTALEFLLGHSVRSSDQISLSLNSFADDYFPPRCFLITSSANAGGSSA